MTDATTRRPHGYWNAPATRRASYTTPANQSRPMPWPRTCSTRPRGGSGDMRRMGEGAVYYAAAQVVADNGA